jgi:KipI family sensor histidine kinase inhibitor
MLRRSLCHDWSLHCLLPLAVWTRSLMKEDHPCELAGMGLRALGDSAWLFEAGGASPRARLELVLKLVDILERERIAEVLDMVSSFDSVAVHFDPADGGRVLDWLTSLPPPAAEDAGRLHSRTVEIPVCYDGADLETVARELGRSVEDVVSLHGGAEYTVAALGFSPGFPYLTGLPEELRLPRRATPRRVTAGAVAMAGGQAGIYPFASQGGWHVLGRTGLCLFDPARENPSLLEPGDRVRFVAVESVDQAFVVNRAEVGACHGGVEVLESGGFTTVQDMGRSGFRHLGITPGGAGDPVMARVANRLLGNPDDAAVLECCMSGPLLGFHENTRAAFIGWGDAAAGRPLEMTAGMVLDLRGRMLAARGYIAIEGGIDVPLVLGGRATDVRSGFGGFHGRILKPGDRLPLGPRCAGPEQGGWRVGWPRLEAQGRMIELRYLPGMQSVWFTTDARERFRSSIYQTSPMSDRMGTRLDGPLLELVGEREMVSQPVAPGSVQVPPDGRPVVLMAECQTIGGYPQIGHVISADLPALARAWPGTPLRFREVTLDEAREAWSALRRDFAFLQAGLDFLR